jgi:hypothetical protein
MTIKLVDLAAINGRYRGWFRVESVLRETQYSVRSRFLSVVVLKGFFLGAYFVWDHTQQWLAAERSWRVDETRAERVKKFRDAA